MQIIIFAAMIPRYNSKQVRQLFLDFFKEKKHRIMASAPIVIQNDPSLFFVNAGMNSFKDYLLETKLSPHKRIVNSQKCLRVSGKHNDLEEVGKDHYHHTMFEMLGNWSFGDYFKKEMIAWAWEFITQVCKIPEDLLYVTVFRGDNEDNLSKDDEAYTLWSHHIPESRIILAGKKDSFWEMGEVGPCGPSSEIHIDLRDESKRKKQPATALINADDPDVIEIWNIVFIQYERKKDRSLLPLKQNYIDTGMGLERLTKILNEKKSTYDTDLFVPIIKRIETITNVTYQQTDKVQDVAFRVVADHLRAVIFTIADGQRPSNTGPGYVVRRILRRAVRYYYSYLAYKSPLLCQLVGILDDIMGDVFPEIKQKEYLQKIIREEEKLFIKTLQSGLKRLEKHINDAKQNTPKILPKEQAFEMYDTYGFPLDLTLLIVQEHHIDVDQHGFQEELQKQKNRSRKASLVSTEDWVEWCVSSDTSFVGYDKLECTTSITKYRKVQQQQDYYQIVLAETPFYAEGGGQAGDTGIILYNDLPLHVFNTKKEGQLIVHYTKTEPPPFWKEQTVIAKVDATKRQRIAAHHTATHLLHAALRKILGKHVVQKGCQLTESKIRFDFAHKSPLHIEEIQQIETLIFKKIVLNLPVQIETMKKAKAFEMGTMALFGEKYEDIVRTVCIDGNFSLELCGGTHVEKTGEIGLVKIIEQSAVASGVRRIEAVANDAAMQHLHTEAKQWQEVKAVFRNPPDIVTFVKKQQEDLKRMQKMHKTLELKLKSYTADKWIEQNASTLLSEKPSIQWIHKHTSLPLEEMKAIGSELIKKGIALCFLSSTLNSKVYILFSADKKLLQTYSIDLKGVFQKVILSTANTTGGGSGNMYSAVCADASFDSEEKATEIKAYIGKKLITTDDQTTRMG